MHAFLLGLYTWASIHEVCTSEVFPTLPILIKHIHCLNIAYIAKGCILLTLPISFGEIHEDRVC